MGQFLFSLVGQGSLPVTHCLLWAVEGNFLFYRSVKETTACIRRGGISILGILIILSTISILGILAFNNMKCRMYIVSVTTNLWFLIINNQCTPGTIRSL